MNNALQFHIRTSLKNMVKRTLKRPLKTIGLVFLIVYFLMIPFLMKDMIQEFGFATPEGFVLASTMLTVYITMPATLSYFKRNGVVFRKQDVNFLFPTPISPKQILFYALFKQAFMSLLMQMVAVIAAIFVFKIPVYTSLLYGLSSLIFSSLQSYSLAIIMYGSERLTESNKKHIKWFVYACMAVVSGLVLMFFIERGVSVASATELVKHPIILSIPIFGWELGWLNLIVLGLTPLRLITGVLFLISSILLGFCAYKMNCTGSYYEDALKFSERQASLESKKGNVSVNEMFGRKRKVHQYKGAVKTRYAQTIFSRQIIERRRTRRYFISFGDLIVLAMGIGAGILMKNTDVDGSLFFVIACGISMYMAIFFTPSSLWKDEFSRYFLYVIPDTMWRKLWYSTLLEHIISLIKAVFLAVPLGLIIGAPLGDIMMVIVAQVLLKAMIVYKSILIDGYVGAKIGTNLAQVVSMFVSVMIVLVPAIVVFLSVATSTLYSFIIVSGYTLVMMGVFMYLCVRVLTNIESLND